jgi:hypothetical protein
MKTSILRTVCFTFGIFLASHFAVKAQEAFYDTKWEDGRMVSRTKYVMGYSGFCEQRSVSKFTYDSEGEFLKKEVYDWTPKYAWDKNGRCYPDYNESNFIPRYRITREKHPVSNMVTMALLLWNKQKKTYDDPIEKTVFQLDGVNRFNYLAFEKDERYVVWVNHIHYDREILAGLGE